MSLTDGKLGHLLFVAATAVAALIAVALILVGRMGYAKADFVPLPPDQPSPSVPTLPALPAGNPGEIVYGTSIGSPDAPVIMVMYSDFLCSACQQFAATTEPELRKAFIETGQMRLVYKPFIVNGEESILAAEAAESAAEQNEFWPYYDRLMQAKLSSHDLSIEKLEGLAEGLGLDMTAFDVDLRSGKYHDQVISDDAEARELGVRGPPTFFINRMKGLGNKPFEAFQKVISEILEGSSNGK